MGKFHSGNSRAATLTAGAVMTIRQRYANGATQSELCREYGVTVTQIGRIVRGESWQHLPMAEPRQADLEASATRLMALQKELIANGELAAPPIPVETAMEKMARETEERRRKPDELLNELTKANDGNTP